MRKKHSAVMSSGNNVIENGSWGIDVGISSPAVSRSVISEVSDSSGVFAKGVKRALMALVVLTFILGYISCPVVATAAAGQENQQSIWNAIGLGHRGFQQVNKDGFGSFHNSYAWSSAWYKGRLYVGTNRDMLCYLSVVFGTDPASLPDVNCDDPDYYGEIWAFDPEMINDPENAWERVYRSPEAASPSGSGSVPRDQGYRGMQVVVEPDGTEALYVGGYISREVVPVDLPARLLRSVDGKTFKEVRSSDGSVLGNIDTFGLRSFTQYKGKLYMTANMNPPQRPKLLEADLATLTPSGTSAYTMNIRQVNNTAEVQPFEIEVFNNYLYIGTVDADNGFSVLKTDCTGNPPYTFKPVVTHGAYRTDRVGKDSYNLNEYVISMRVFQNRLYIGTGCGLGGFDFVSKVGPAAAEMIRINPDDSWQLVCGKKRNTPDGLKVPISHLPAGMGNPFSGYFWRMAVHRDWLYVSTMDSSIALRNPDVLASLDPSKLLASDDDSGHNLINIADLLLLPGLMGDGISNLLGGFDLWKTRNGVQWYPVTTTGFGDKFNIGARIMESTPLGFFIGTANPYYGTQIWLGDDHFPLARNLQAEPDENGAKLRWTAPQGTTISHVYRRQILGGINGLFDGLGLLNGEVGTGQSSLSTDGFGLKEIAATQDQFYIDTNARAGTLYLYQVSCEGEGGGLSDRSNLALCRIPSMTEDGIFWSGSTRILEQRLRPDRLRGQWTQWITVINQTDETMSSPLNIILEGLANGLSVLNMTGTAENGSPYLSIPVGSGGLLPRERVQVQLRFRGKNSSRISYIPFVTNPPVEP
ncbi:MAG: hypothetical protein AB1847_07190 [bacterium]